MSKPLNHLSGPRAFAKHNLQILELRPRKRGQLGNLLPHLFGLLIPYAVRGDAVIYQFSNKVENVPLDQLRKGQVRSTMGTDINCVVRHLLDTKPTARRALVLTDGYTGKPHPEYVRELKARGIRLHVVMPAESANRADLQDIARSIGWSFISHTTDQTPEQALLSLYVRMAAL